MKKSEWKRRLTVYRKIPIFVMQLGLSEEKCEKPHTVSLQSIIFLY